MESSLERLKLLIEEGEKFTFENFSAQLNRIENSTFGGEDSPEWLAWKTRTFNLVKELTEEESSASRLASEANAIQTQGNYRDKFERAKPTFLKALKLTQQALTEDAF